MPFWVPPLHCQLSFHLFQIHCQRSAFLPPLVPFPVRLLLFFPDVRDKGRIFTSISLSPLRTPLSTPPRTFLRFFSRFPLYRHLFGRTLGLLFPRLKTGPLQCSPPSKKPVAHTPGAELVIFRGEVLPPPWFFPALHNSVFFPGYRSDPRLIEPPFG